MQKLWSAHRNTSKNTKYEIGSNCLAINIYYKY